MHMMDDFAMMKDMPKEEDLNQPLTPDQEEVLDELGTMLYAGRYADLDEAANEAIVEKLYECGILQPEDL